MVCPEEMRVDAMRPTTAPRASVISKQDRICPAILGILGRICYLGHKNKA